MYLQRGKKISPYMGGYVVADTSNPTGFRPQYTRLGEQLGPMRVLPDWKTAVALRDGRIRQQSAVASNRRRANMARAAAVDAQARGARFNPQLSGLGLVPLDLSGQMTQGATYTFHFQASGFGVIPSPSQVSQAVAADTNFVNVIAASEANGIKVLFTYNGQGSTLGQAGLEMQNVIQSALHGTLATISGTGLAVANLIFYAAEDASGAAAQQAAASGSDSSQSSTFDFGSFFTGLGTGGALAVVGGGLLLLVMAVRG